MVEQAGDTSETEQLAPTDPAAGMQWRRWPLVLGGALLLFAVLLIGLWSQRAALADRIIANQLEQLKLQGTYEVERIGPRRQVLTNVVIGDPARPDFTVTRAEIEIEPRLGIPALRSVTLTGARLYGSWRSGTLSFGKLDPILFKDQAKDTPFRLPDLDLRLRDARARMDSDHGSAGFKLEGAGNLRSGFAGTMAAIMPHAAFGGCQLDRLTVYGQLTISAEQPRFVGPVRSAALTCPGQTARAANLAAAVDVTLDRALDGAALNAEIETGALVYAGQSARQLAGTTNLTVRHGDLTAAYDLTARGARIAGTAVGRLGVKGGLRTLDHLARIESEGVLTGAELRLASGLDAVLAQAERTAQGSLAAPMAAQIRAALARQLPGSALEASYRLRQSGGVTSLIVPRAAVRGGGGAILLGLSRLDVLLTPGAAPRFAGNFLTGGPGLPVLSGQLQRQPGGGVVGRMKLADYRAGSGRLALPELVLVQNRDGSVGFGGRAVLSGPLPGGSARNLALPLDGTWSPRGGLALWRRCAALTFDELGYANLSLTSRQLTLCPGPGGAILRAGAGGVRLAAGAPKLNLAGRLGSTPIRIASGAAGFAMPGALATRDLRITLGPAANATTFRISNLTAQVGREIAGRFADTEARIGAVPLDIVGASGAWRYAGGTLMLSDGAFRLEDRNADDRFRPLIARGASLTLANSQIAAGAVLREPASDREITSVSIRHDLGRGIGHADLAVAGLTFDRQIQPDTLTYLAQGVIALAKGTVTGAGQVDWTPDRVSSRGRFSTDDLDFAAAFGPVEGAAGTVVFTDLLGLVTAPDQRIRVAKINPGIEVNDGILSFQLKPDYLLQINGATWPFMDGTLRLLPTRMVLGAAEQRRFELEVEGLNSAKFVERLEFGNISATGIFDGRLPLVFDENGGEIVGGLLTSRAPGGNVSYVGELSYRDLSAMGNLAFETLKSLDYRQMTIGMNGQIDGEIVTQVKFDGVSQGRGAKRNFITRRLAGLPIQFNVNLRASFIELMTSLRSLYDETYIPDPRALGLIDKDGKPVDPAARAPIVPVNPSANTPANTPASTPNNVQPSVSRNRR